ncbi:hypothetical protein ACFQVD_00165 [Streptosporangium amethystogenes subsp. fukuiense]|uniref:Core-binding (CB) domain-containing protein n=2 Tax=Streptosporangium amethystogenes TaxID=2002 RepID=A0ABW2SS72_9ACTN
MSDDSITDDRQAIFEFVRFLSGPVWTAGPEDADRFLTAQRKLGRAKSTVQHKAWTIAQFFDFLIIRYQGDVHALTGHVLCQPHRRVQPAGQGRLRNPADPATQQRGRGDVRRLAGVAARSP